MSPPVITLLTDFGQVDGYVGTMKGVILRLCPRATLVDLSHDIAPHALQQAAYVLSSAAPYFPSDSVHLVVVDPGVGTMRRPIIVRTRRATFVAPDNGVLTLALAQDPAQIAVRLAEPGYQLPQVSATFHGRDVFAPAAAHLATGASPREMGELLSVSDLVTLPQSQPTRRHDGSWPGEVLHIDRFGNLVTSFLCSQNGPQYPATRTHLAVPSVAVSVTVAGIKIQGLVRTFADVEPQEPLAYVGSSGHLEIAVREGNAAAQLGVQPGDPVQVVGMTPLTRLTLGSENAPGTPWALPSAGETSAQGQS